jgi:hemoglobin
MNDPSATTSVTLQPRAYGDGDASFQAAGGVEGIRRLVAEFYRQMDTLPEAAAIRAMHPSDLSGSADKLHRFLCGWLGGPKLYMEKYGSIHIPSAHAHLAIGEQERDAWLLCMERALAMQNYPQDFRDYLLRELFRPAEGCRLAATKFRETPRSRDD